MAVVVTEKHDSLTYTADTSIERKYQITGTTSETTAMLNLQRTAPLLYKTFVRGNCTVTPLSIDLNNPAICIWEGTVPYAPMGAATREPMAVGESLYAFETGGGTQHITQSLETVNSYGTGLVPNHKGAIGVTKGGVEGVDIIIPIFRWSETHIVAAAVVTPRYVGTLYALTGQTNNAVWRTFPAGDVLFEGASGSKRGEGDWEIRFSFAASPSKTDQTVGDIMGVVKAGWDYMWIRYKDTVQEVGGVKYATKIPEAVYVERVYESGNFAGLRIGN